MKTDIKTLLEFAGVDTTKGKAKKLCEDYNDAEQKMMYISNKFNELLKQVETTHRNDPAIKKMANMYYDKFDELNDIGQFFVEYGSVDQAEEDDNFVGDAEFLEKAFKYEAAGPDAAIETVAEEMNSLIEEFKRHISTGQRAH